MRNNLQHAKYLCDQKRGSLQCPPLSARRLPRLATVLAVSFVAVATAPTPVLAQTDTAEGRTLLSEAIVETYRTTDCVFVYDTDEAVDRFYDRMDRIAERKFRSAGLEFPKTVEARDAAFLPVFDALLDRGLIIDDEEAQTDRFPSACKDQ